VGLGQIIEWEWQTIAITLILIVFYQVKHCGWSQMSIEVYQRKVQMQGVSMIVPGLVLGYGWRAGSNFEFTVPLITKVALLKLRNLAR
jgi:hypothetical protein